MAQKYYVIWKGRETGIFTDWSSCKKHIDHFPGARYKSFKTLSEAEQAFKGTSTNGAAKPATKRQASTVKTYTAAEIKALDVDTMIFTDGGCEPNPGEAGSGLAVYREGEIAELWYGLYNSKGTNNTAELNALYQAMVMAGDEVKQARRVAIFCDSKYAIQCVTQWAAGWEKKGWKKAGGEIKNLSLIQAMYALYQKLKANIQILHVNGHVGVEGNELADRMSILAIEKQDPDFVRFSGLIDIEAILAKRNG
ncbi:MAG: viroplasmin family protein [Oleiphilus sp.]